MSYQVLARKYRPRNFDEMVGQEHVLKALTNALANQRLHHAYIFAGTRGVGKTTVARIFAKCLNNPDGISPTPDQSSEIAKSIDKGQFIDLIEVDAASRTKVEQTRELLENIAYPPSQGRFKIYLIDEAHMLSTHSFNALLKTLEEPPGFVKFLFATTEVNKLPITILSRCLLFNLQQIPEEQIAAQLEKILKQEGIACDQPSASLLAKVGKGSLRDALSITDQAIAHANGKLNSDDLAQFLGMLDLTRLDQLLEALLAGKAVRLLELARGIAEFGPNYDNLIEQLMERLQSASVAQFVGQQTDSSLARRLARELSPETLQLYYQLLLRGKSELAMLDNQAMGFEMLLLRLLVFTPAQDSQQNDLALAGAGQLSQVHQPGQVEIGQADQTGKPKPIAQTGREGETGQSNQPGQTSQPHTIDQSGQAQQPDTRPGGVLPHSNDDWTELFGRLELEGFARQLAGYASFASCDEQGNLTLSLGAQNYAMMNTTYKEQIRQAMEQCLSSSFSLAFQSIDQPPQDSPLMQQKHATEDESQVLERMENDPDVQSLIKDFDGRIVNVTTPDSNL